MPETDVNVIGAGVAGLALARLAPRDRRVHLYDAAWDARTVPTVFGLWPSAMRALDALGLAAAVRERGRPLDAARIHDRTGAVLAGVGGRDVCLVSRTDLVALLRKELPANVVVHRERVDDPDALPGELVVGADGVHSTVRRALWGRAGRPRRLGATAVRGVVDEPVAGDALEEYWGPGALFGMTPRPGGGTNWFVTVPVRRFAGPGAALAEVRDRFAAHPARVRRVLAAAEPELTLVNDLWAARWPRRLVRGRAVLVGDSAHAMSPSLGRGAGEALVDAVVLGAALRELPVRAALRRYERGRLLPPQGVRWASAVALRVAMTRRERVRNRVVSLAPG